MAAGFVAGIRYAPDKGIVIRKILPAGLRIYPCKLADPDRKFRPEKDDALTNKSEVPKISTAV